MKHEKLNVMESMCQAGVDLVLECRAGLTGHVFIEGCLLRVLDEVKLNESTSSLA